MTASPRSRSRSYENRRKNNRRTSWSNSSTFSNCSRHKLSQSETSWTPPLPLEGAENLTVVVKNKNASTKKRKKEKRHRRDDRKKDKPYRRERKKYKYDRHTPEKSAKEVFASGDNILVSVSFGNKKDKSSATSTSHIKDKDTLAAKDSVSKRDKVSHTKRSKNDYDYDRYRVRDRSERSPKRSRSDKYQNRDRENNNVAKTSTSIRVQEKPIVKHRKIDIKPVAIIDLDRSPFKEMTPSPKDIIVLSDESDIEVKEISEPSATKPHTSTNNSKKDDKNKTDKNSMNKSDSNVSPVDISMTPPLNLLDTLFPEMLGGPKTPPEVPSVVKFSMAVKSKNTKLRPINLLHDEKEEEEEDEKLEKNNAANDQSVTTTTTVTATSTTTTAAAETTTADTSNVDETNNSCTSNINNQNKVGPNTPPDPVSFSPDTYDPFEPTKSPSNSSIPPDNSTENNDDPGNGDAEVHNIDDDDDDDDDDNHNDDAMDIADDNEDDDDDRVENQLTETSIISSSTSTTATAAPTSTLTSKLAAETASSATVAPIPLLLPENPVDFVMALINKTTNTNCDSNKIPSILEMKNDKGPADNSLLEDVTNAAGGQKQITVLSNILLTTSMKPPNMLSQQQNGTGIGNSAYKYNSTVLKPLTAAPAFKSGSIISKLPLPGQDKLNLNSHNSCDDIPDLESSPYSPRSSDYEDLFEPPSDTGQVSSTQNFIRNNNNNNISNNNNDKSSPNNSKLHSSAYETFDHLFGSISPTQKIISSTSTLYRNKINKMNSNKQQFRRQQNNFQHVEDDEALLDDVPSSAVALQIEDKYLKKLNRQERVVEEVKLVLKPHYNKKYITKDEYKDILRKSVPKICHSRTGEINPMKIQALIDAYVKKVRHKRKTL